MNLPEDWKEATCVFPESLPGDSHLYYELMKEKEEMAYFPPAVEVLSVLVEKGYAGSQLPGREPIRW